MLLVECHQAAWLFVFIFMCIVLLLCNTDSWYSIYICKQCHLIFHDRFCQHYKKNKIHFCLTHSTFQGLFEFRICDFEQMAYPAMIIKISFHSLYIFRERYKLPKCYNHYMSAYYLIMSSGLEITKWGPV